jgi:ankyrin repeat protein
MVKDCNGYTPLLKAASLNRVDMVKALIEVGADPTHTDEYG